MMLFGCRQEPEIEFGGAVGELIAFNVEPLFTVETKAAEVTSLESFYVSAVTGGPGSEVEAWTSTPFNLVPASAPPTYTANKFWPANDPSYSFYASNRPLTYHAEGATVSASNEVDVVCAYRTGNTYKSKNTLTFGHIFARLGTVSVVAVPGYTLSNVVIQLTPRTGGTYNLRTGEWADVATGTATTIASNAGDNANDLWLVPGEYTVTASWTATDREGYTDSYSGKTAEISVREGAVNAVGIAMGGNITAGVEIAEYEDLVCVQDSEPLTFEALGDGDILWKSNGGSLVRTIEYSKDNGQTWTSVTSTAAGAPIPVNTGDKVLIRGNSTTYGETNIRYCYFSGTVNYYVYGDVTDLLPSGYKGRLEPYCFYRLFNGDSYLYNHESKDICLPSLVMGSYCYANMFQNCVNLSRAPALPAMSLASFCYAYMFTNCPSLEATPELPATRLAPSCYANMFTACPGIKTTCSLPATVMTESCYSYMYQGCSALTSAPTLPSTELAPSCYKNMFSSCSSLLVAPELPATELKSNCYAFMFSNCTGFTSVPVLPATDVAEFCYYSMFAGCTGLIHAPVLPAMAMANSCYMQMFYSCTSLTDAPQLPATTLANSCYQDMFAYCSALTNPPALPATTLTTYVYYGMFRYCSSLAVAPALPATNLGSECYYEMFYGCPSLVVAPELPATVLQNNCYRGMFNRCTSLTTAPVLPAKTLAPNCYIQMFSGCSSLNYIKALFTTTPVTGYTNNWVNGVAATGTFVKADDATWDVTGNYGVPDGWTVVRESS